MDDDDDDVDGEDAPKVKTHFVKTKGEFTVEASLSIHCYTGIQTILEFS